MKKLLACLLLALLLLLCGCGKKEEEPVGEAGLSETEFSETEFSEAEEDVSDFDEEDIWEDDDFSAPVETPAPTPIPVVDINSYTYSKANDPELDLSFKYPSHWIGVPGTYTLSFEEPVEEGEIPSRVSVTTKDYEGEATKSMVQQEAKDFSSVISTTCAKYDRDHVGTDVQLLGHAAYSFQYTGEIDGQDIRGCAIVGFNETNHKLYAVNFYSVKKKFRHFDIVRRVITESVGRAS